jgi:hypothetical protein
MVEPSANGFSPSHAAPFLMLEMLP